MLGAETAHESAVLSLYFWTHLKVTWGSTCYTQKKKSVKEPDADRGCTCLVEPPKCGPSKSGVVVSFPV